MKAFSTLLFLTLMVLGALVHADANEDAFELPVAGLAGVRTNAENNYSNENPQKTCPNYFAPGTYSDAINKGDAQNKSEDDNHSGSIK